MLAAAATPAEAAPLQLRDAAVRAGAFAGGRFLLSFGGPDAELPRASLMVAPTFVRQGSTGFRHSYGAGVEFGFAGRDPHLSAGGMALWSGAGLAAGRDRRGLSTLGTAGVVLAGAALIGGVILVAQVAEGNRNSD